MGVYQQKKANAAAYLVLCTGARCIMLPLLKQSKSSGEIEAHSIVIP